MSTVRDARWASESTSEKRMEFPNRKFIRWQRTACHVFAQKVTSCLRICERANVRMCEGVCLCVRMCMYLCVCVGVYVCVHLSVSVCVPSSVVVVGSWCIRSKRTNPSGWSCRARASARLYAVVVVCVHVCLCVLACVGVHVCMCVWVCVCVCMSYKSARMQFCVTVIRKR